MNQQTDIKETDMELAPPKPGEMPMRTLSPFSSFNEQAKVIVAEAQGIVVTDATQVTLIKRSKELRLKAKHTRCDLENLRKEKVEGLVKETKAINADANKIKEVLETLEARLLENEQFAERAEAARMNELRDKRVAELFPLVTGPIVGDLAALSEAEWTSTLSDAKVMNDARLAREAKQKKEADAKIAADKLRTERRIEIAPFANFTAELAGLDLGVLPEAQYADAVAKAKTAKIEHDKAQEVQRLENERLQRAVTRAKSISHFTLAAAVERPEDLGSMSDGEFGTLVLELESAHKKETKRLQDIADEAAAKLKAEREAAQVERDQAAAALKKTQDEAAERQREAQEKADAEAKKLREAEAELAAKKAAEDKAAADKKAADKAAAAATDKVKLATLVAAIRAFALPDFTDPKLGEFTFRARSIFAESVDSKMKELSNQ